MKRRTVALLLSLVMAVCCLSGCTSTRVRSYSEESSDASTNKYAAALNAYKSNKKVMTINGSTVYWNEYAYFLCAIMANMERYGMQITDWSAVYNESTGETYSDIVTKSVVNNIAWNHLIEVKAAENDVTFDAAGEQFVQDTVDQTIRNVVGDGGTEAELNEKLQSYYMDLDLFKYFTKTQYLYNGLASKLFGENGANISDEDVQEYAETNSYMTAKHILFKTTDDSGTALSDADKAAKKQQAEQDKGLLFPQAHGAKSFVFLPDEGLKVERQLGTHDKKQRIYGKGRIEQAGREVVQEVRTPRYGGACRLRIQAHRHGHIHAGREEGQLGNRHGQQGTDHQRGGLFAAGLDIEALANADRQDGEDGRLACDRGDKRRHDIAGQHESP